jgi:hypothetical protein
MDINASGYVDYSTAIKNAEAKIDSILDGSDFKEYKGLTCPYCKGRLNDIRKNIFL